MQNDQPDVVHLSGVDLHQGRVLLNIEPGADERQWDGLFLSDAVGGHDAVLAEDLARLLTPAGGRPPALVSCNFYHSAARVAAMVVAHGAGAAIGFQDEFDDGLAERFFGNFYQLWQAHDWDLLAAFQEALFRMSGPQLRGTGIVLWSAQPLVRETRKQISTDFVKRRREERRRPIEQFGTGTGTGTASPPIAPDATGATRTGTGSGSLRDLFAVNLKPPRQINYSLLHNRERLFDSFTITPAEAGLRERDLGQSGTLRGR